MKLRDLLNFTVADAGCADADAASSPLHQRSNRLQIQVPAALGYIMGVTDPVAELRAPATNIANSCHKTEISLVFRRIIIPMRVPSRQPAGAGIYEPCPTTPINGLLAAAYSFLGIRPAS